MSKTVFTLPRYLTSLVEKPSRNEDQTLEYAVTGPGRVNEMFFIYRTIDEPQDLFKRMTELTIAQNGRILHRLTPTVWSTMLVLQNKQFIKNRIDSKLYIPLIHEGLDWDASRHPITITVKFRNYQKEHERVGFIMQYDTLQGPREAPTHYWTLTNPVYVKVPAMESKDLFLDIPLPWLSAGMTLGQLVFHIPGANAFIKGGSIRAVRGTVDDDADDPREKDITVHEFHDAYHAAVMDKLLFDMPLPKSSLLTCTFANWQKQSADQGLRIAPDYAMILHLDLENLPEDQRPKDASVEVFAIIGVQR